jgi:hypothetical protein
LKVTPSFCFAFKIPDDRAVTTTYIRITLRTETDTLSFQWEYF